MWHLQTEVVNIIVFHWIISIVFPRWFTVRGQSIQEKSCVVIEDCICLSCGVRNAVKRRLRCACHLIRGDYCGVARVVQMSRSRGCRVTAGFNWHVLRKMKKKRKNKNRECTTGKSNQFRIFSILRLWHLILPSENLKKNFSLWIC